MRLRAKKLQIHNFTKNYNTIQFIQMRCNSDTYVGTIWREIFGLDLYNFVNALMTLDSSHETI